MSDLVTHELASRIDGTGIIECRAAGVRGATVRYGICPALVPLGMSLLETPDVVVNDLSSVVTDGTGHNLLRASRAELANSRGGANSGLSFC